MDLKNKSDLEQYFAENFDTVFFPLLADLYKNENDLSRAKKVCEIGLEYHPDNIPGAFILAEINQLQGNLLQAEKYYKNILVNCPWHYRALVNLVKIETELDRSKETISKIWTRIVKINPTHTEARLFLELPPVKEPFPLKSTTVEPDKKDGEKDATDKGEGEQSLKEKVEKDKEAKPAKEEQNKVNKEEIEKSSEVQKAAEEAEEKQAQKNEKLHEEKPLSKEETEIGDADKSGLKDPESKEAVSQNIDEEVQDLKKKLGEPDIKEVEKDIFKEMSIKTNEINVPKTPVLKQQKNLDEEELQSLDITPRMATFTMVNVLKRQKLYQQALYVLKMLEEKGADQALIDQEKQKIQELLDQSKSE